MEAAPTLRPIVTRQQSKVPGGFDTDDENSPTKSRFEDDTTSTFGHSRQASTTWQSAVGGDGDGTSGYALSDDNGMSSLLPVDDSTIRERDMKRRLMDFESSFLGEMSEAPLEAHEEEQLERARQADSEDYERSGDHYHEEDPFEESQQLPTPPEAYKTPAPHPRQQQQQQHNPQDPHSEETSELSHNPVPTTSSLETMSSSPTAAAAARTVSRVVSMASIGGYETANEDNTESQDEISRHGYPHDYSGELATPTPGQSKTLSAPGSPTPTRPSTSNHVKIEEGPSDADVDETSSKSVKHTRKRPKYLNHRFSSQRSSRSSYTSIGTNEGASDLTVGADFALQTGGGLPLNSSLSSRPSGVFLSRATSIGSMASNISTPSEHEERMRFLSAGVDNLDPLAEEISPPQSAKESQEKQYHLAASPPQTPRGTARDLPTPTETVINQRVKDFEVPATIAKKYLDRGDSRSPSRPNSLPTPANKRVKNLTLKEQSSKVDELTKENFKLKLKVYYLDQTLAERSDESVKAMVSENVELKARELGSKKEIRALKRDIRELEAKLRERDINPKPAQQPSVLSENDRQSVSAATETTTQVVQELENEVIFLRERVDVYEVENHKLQSENAAKESEKRRLAEAVRLMSDRKQNGSDVGIRDEIDMWKDLLEHETALKTQADEENRRLREEVLRLRSDAAVGRSQGMTITSGVNGAIKRPHTSNGEYLKMAGQDSLGGATAETESQKALRELQQENAELRREVGAQASMLTSRHREKERLYQEIEDLKIQRLAGGGAGAKSTTGDSIFERSASRAFARGGSRTSSQSRTAYMSEAERDTYETQNGDLRDQLNKLRLEHTEMAQQVNSLLDEIEGKISREEFDQLARDFEETEAQLEMTQTDLLKMQEERDNALESEHVLDQDYQTLEQEANQRINEMDRELQQNAELVKNLQNDVAVRDKEMEDLRNEVRMTTEGIDRVEADIQSKLRRIKDLEFDNEEIARESESIEKSLYEANNKCEKLLVELESRQNECAFLREEQDGFVLKINDFETALRTAQTSLRTEKEKTKELEARLQDERQQREIVEGKGKQEVQKMMNDLNRESSNAKEEARKWRKIVDTKELEVKTYKERMMDLEDGLREVLGDVNGSTKSSFVIAITKLQSDLENTHNELDKARIMLSDKERILHRRDALLESTGLESRKLADLLEKERAGRRADLASREQWERTNQHTSRTVSHREGRIADLEAGRVADRKKIESLQARYTEQLRERNNLLLNLWNRISALCGSDWVHQNSIVSGAHLPSVDVIDKFLPGFSKNLLAAIKNIEGTISTFHQRLKAIDRDLTKDYQHLESNLDMRIKRLDRIESAVQMDRVTSAANAAPEIAQLKAKNRLLRADIEELTRHLNVAKHTSVSRTHHDSATPPNLPASPSNNNNNNGHSSRSVSRQSVHGGILALPPNASLIRASSTSAVEQLSRHSGAYQHVEQQMSKPSKSSKSSAESSSSAMGTRVEGSGGTKGQTMSFDWYLMRLNEFERRMKKMHEEKNAEKIGADRRLEELEREKDALMEMLEKERMRTRGLLTMNGLSGGNSGGAGGGNGDDISAPPLSDEKERNREKEKEKERPSVRSRKEGGSIFGRLRSGSIGTSKGAEKDTD